MREGHTGRIHSAYGRTSEAGSGAGSRLRSVEGREADLKYVLSNSLDSEVITRRSS